jgi:hypothetical protein
VLNPVWVFLVIGEIPSIYAIAGGCVIIFLVALRTALAVRRSGQFRERPATRAAPQETGS